MDKKQIISPSLTIYKPQLVTMLSIMGRITGVILSIVCYLWVLLSKLKGMLLTNYICYSMFFILYKSEITGLLVGGVVLFVLLVYNYHILFAIRNIVWFIWEDKINMDLETIYKVGYTIVLVSIVFSIIDLLYILLN